MKKLLLLLACAFVGMTAQAGKVTEQEALLKAQQFMQDRQFKHSGMRRASQKDAATPGYYVFNAEDNGGFVIVAGDDRMRSILGYAEKGSFDQETLPDNIKWLMDYYAQVAGSLPAQQKNSALAASVSRPELQPLITTTWDQWAPYNAHCPEINGQLPPTGCVATAMAQVINYFQWPINEVRSMADYTTNTNYVYVPGLPARKIGWYNMSDDEIAWLMRYCGQAVQMDYMPDESGARAIDIAGALVSVFNYSRTINLATRMSYSDNDWEELIYSELSVGHPVIYNGDAGEGTSGHSFILHGYKDGLFCVNWGWSGQCDGYFALTNLSPNDSQHYTENQNAIIAIQPASNNDDSTLTVGEERTVQLDKAGTLSELISKEDRYKIKKLTISGDLNGTDFILIREMASTEEGQLATLDLTDANIVKGGDPYYWGYTTKDNTLGEWVFFRCDKLQSVILPNSITAIERSAFEGSDLRTITIPKNVTNIGTGIFSGCRNLAVVEVEEGNPTYYSAPGSNVVIERANPRVIAGCPNSVIPEGITTIASFAFSVYMNAINLPESLTTIEEYAFEGAPLKHLHISKNVKTIGTNAFTAAQLQGITVDGGNSFFDSRNNSNCLIETATKTVILGSMGSQIPEGIEVIGDIAFRYNYIESIMLPQSLKKIGDFAFESTHLRYLEIPSSVTSIGNGAFMNLNNLKVCKVKYQTPPSIPKNAFENISEDAKLIVPNGKKDKYKSAEGWKAFNTILEESEYQLSRTVNVATAGTLSSLIPESDWNSFEELILTGQLNDDDLKFIRTNLCSYSSGNMRILDMTNARIEGDILGQEAMRFTHNLEEVKLPNTLKGIAWLSFADSGIKKIVIPKSVTEIGLDVFYQCSNLASISVEAGNEYFDSREDCNAIIETATDLLRIGCRSTIVPNSVVAIGPQAFSGVNGLTSVDLPDGVKSIGNYAFWADEGLTSVTLSKSVTELGSGPFVGCSNMKNFVIAPENPVYDSRNNCNGIIETATNTLIQGFGSTKIPEDVVKIAPQAFQYMNMTSVEIPASVNEIGAAAFLYCNDLTTVISHIKKPFPVNSSVFSGDNMKTAVLYVPFGTKNAYATTSGWGAFPKIIEMDPTGEELDQHAVSVAESDFGTQYAGLNDQVEVPIYVVGGSIDPITNIDYTITTGSNVYEGHMDVDPITYMMTTEVLIPFKADASVGEKTKVITITKVNGLTNEATENSASGTLVTVKRKPKFVPLVEEATGTWCGWCPRGAVGLKLLNKTFRNDVVTVAVHTNDPMELPGYSLNASGFPSCQINRGEFCDPYYGSSDQIFGIKKDVEAAMRQYTIGEIAVNAEWTDDSQTAINVSTTTTFVENVTSSPYQIGYLLLEDKQTGTTPDWYQSNYFAGSGNNDPNLKSLVDSPSKIVDIKYDYVPVATWQHMSGIEGSLPPTITSEVPMDYTYTLDISGNTRIQNKARLTVVALLLNKETGEVLNTAKFKFTPDPDPSVVTVKNCSRTYGDANPVFEYTVTGGALEGTPEITCEAMATSPVGEYPIVIKQGTVTNEEVTYIDGILTITKAPLTISAGNYTKKQGEAMPKFEATYEGFKNGETVAVLTKKPVFSCEATAASAPGEYPVTVSGAEAQNYNINYVAGVLLVTEADPVTVTAKSYTRKYGDANPAFEYTTEGAELKGEPVITCEATVTSPVGEYPIIISKGTVENYNDHYVNGVLTIEAAPLTISAGRYTKREGEVLPEFTLTYEGFKNGETAEVLTKQPVVSCEATADSAPGEYPVIVSGAEAENYAISYVAGVLVVTELPYYTLTYLVDGTLYKSYSIKEGTTITHEAEPSKEGYTFSGWSEIPDRMPAHDVTVTGTFSINSYKLTYMIDDNIYKEVMYEYGAIITPEPQPEGDYAHFEWVGLPETMPANDVTVYASYETGITDILMLRGVKAIYAPNGKKLDKLQKGLNIVVMEDRTVKRVVIK